MRLPIDTGTVKFAETEPTGPVIDDRVEANRGDRGPTLLLTVEEAASLLRIGRTNMYGLVMRGEVQSVKIGRRRLVVRGGLMRYVDELQASPAPI